MIIREVVALAVLEFEADMERLSAKLAKQVNEAWLSRATPEDLDHWASPTTPWIAGRTKPSTETK